MREISETTLPIRTLKKTLSLTTLKITKDPKDN